MLTRKIEKEIIQAVTAGDIRETMEKKFKWSTQMANMIDWEIHGNNLVRQTFYPHRFTVRLIHKQLPCLAEPFTIANNKMCPCCGLQDENHEHMQQCSENPEKWEPI